MMKRRMLGGACLVSKQVEKLVNSSQVESFRLATTVSALKQEHADDALLSNAKSFEEMPSFYNLPWLGSSWIYFPIIGLYKPREMNKNMFDKRTRLGDIFREKVGAMSVVFSFNPDDLQVIFKHEGQYPARVEFTTLKTYRESRKDWYPSSGLLVLEGKEWWDLRSKTQKQLMKPKAVLAYLDPMQEVAGDFIKKILVSRDSNKEVPNFLNELYKWALESVALVGLDSRLGSFDLNLTSDSDGMKIINAVQTQIECMGALEPITGNFPFFKYFRTPMWKKFENASDTFTEIAFKYINRSLEDLKKNAEDDTKDMTLLQSLLVTKGLELSGVMVTVSDMLMAGIDTTSHSVGFLLYNLARNPEKQEHLYEELIRLLPGKEDRISTKTFNEFKYLKACLKESMRLYPIVGGVGRRLDHDVVLSGFRVPAGTLLGVGLQAVCLDEKYFTNPKKYIPERWLEKEENFHPFSFLPFGFGTRSCIGRRLAELEIISLTTQIIKNFKVEYLHEDIGITTRLINCPDRPLRFSFIER